MAAIKASVARPFSPGCFAARPRASIKQRHRLERHIGIEKRFQQRAIGPLRLPPIEIVREVRQSSRKPALRLHGPHCHTALQIGERFPDFLVIMFIFIAPLRIHHNGHPFGYQLSRRRWLDADLERLELRFASFLDAGRYPAALPASGPRPGCFRSSLASSVSGLRALAAATHSEGLAPILSSPPSRIAEGRTELTADIPGGLERDLSMIGCQPQQRLNLVGRVGFLIQGFQKKGTTHKFGASIQPQACVGAASKGALPCQRRCAGPTPTLGATGTSGPSAGDI